MRLLTDRRFLGLVAAIALAAAGCDNKPKGTGGSAGPAGKSAGPAAATGPNARQFAESILKDLGEGKVGPDRLTAAFKKKLTGPGKDGDTAAAEYLARFKSATFVIPDEGKIGDAVTFHGRAKLPDKSAALSLRLVPNPNGYQVDWLHVSDRQGSEIKMPADAALAAAQDTVRNFLDLVLGGDNRLVDGQATPDARLLQGLMSPDWKKKLAPAPPAEAKKGVEYDTGFLTQTTRAWKRDFLGYTLSTGDLDPNRSTATFVATMDSGNSKTAYVVKATKDKATGEWLVSELDPQQ